jgi:hypothetical protein
MRALLGAQSELNEEPQRQQTRQRTRVKKSR